jgi:ABC-type Na+ transport system ATPase subunit NatA
MLAVDEFNTRAVALLTSDKAREAFDLSREPEAVRERYGIHPWGQRALMARRLVEAGVSFVTMVMENCIPPG